jgi:hypothetical protein
MRGFGLKGSRDDVNDRMELGTKAASVLDTVGNSIAIPCLAPPKCDATCFIQLNGVWNAHAHRRASVLYSPLAL